MITGSGRTETQWRLAVAMIDSVNYGRIVIYLPSAVLPAEALQYQRWLGVNIWP